MYKGARRSGRVLRGTAQVGMGLRNPLWRTVPSLGKLSSLSSAVLPLPTAVSARPSPHRVLREASLLPFHPCLWQGAESATSAG